MPDAFSRRQFMLTGLAGATTVALASPPRLSIGALDIALQTFCLRGLRYPALVAAVQQTGIRDLELFSAQVEPPPAQAPNIFQWRETVSLDYFTAIRQAFNHAGLRIAIYNPRLSSGGGRRGGRGRGRPGGGAPALPARPVPPITDAQLDRVFACAQALGAPAISAQMPWEVVERIAPLAARHRMPVALESVDPALMIRTVALSPWMRMSVDIGNLARLGIDARPLLREQYPHLLTVHLKDAKAGGTSVPFGEGDAHMREVVRFLATQKGDVRTVIDCDYPGTGASVAEVRKCYAYVQSCLA